MRSRVFIAAVLFAGAILAAGSASAEYRVRFLSPPSPLQPHPVFPPGFAWGSLGLQVELPPFSLDLPAGRRYFVSTGSTHTLDAQATSVDPSSVRRQTISDAMRDYACPVVPQNSMCAEPASTALWRRTYYGVYSTQTAACPDSPGQCVLAFIHGENKNGSFCDPAAQRQCRSKNSLVPWANYPWPSYEDDSVYAGFVGVSSVPVGDNASDGLLDRDRGPILWPSMGYLSAQDEWLGQGVRHPLSLRAGDHYYVFYVETQDPGTGIAGREKGLKVARAPVGNWGPGQWKTYFDGRFEQASLPPGFSSADRSFLKQPGGRSDAVFPASPSCDNLPCTQTWLDQFSVVRAAGTPVYLGLSYDSLQQTHLRASADLVNWGPPLRVPNEFLHCTYPRLVSADLSDFNQVDPGDFAVVCTQLYDGQAHVSSRPMVKRLSVAIDWAPSVAWATDSGQGRLLEGALGGPQQSLPFPNIKQVRAAAGRVGVLTADGWLHVRENGAAQWTAQTGDVQDFALTADRVGIVKTDGFAYVKQGELTAGWTVQSGDVLALALSGDRIGILKRDGSFHVKKGGLSAQWSLQTGDARAIALAGNRIGVIKTDGFFYVKEGGLDAAWAVQTADIQAMSLSRNRVAAWKTDGVLYVKEGALTAGWVAQSGDLRMFAVSDSRVAIEKTDNRVYVKEGGLTAGWSILASDVAALALSPE